MNYYQTKAAPVGNSDDISIEGQDVTVIAIPYEHRDFGSDKVDSQTVLVIGYLTPDEETKQAAREIADGFRIDFQNYTSITFHNFDDELENAENLLNLKRQNYLDQDGLPQSAYQFNYNNMDIRIVNYQNGVATAAEGVSSASYSYIEVFSKPDSFNVTTPVEGKPTRCDGEIATQWFANKGFTGYKSGSTYPLPAFVPA